jgi:4-amino-4-deoxy-L-arabinose transferase and related glycosyltransferases of PMT family
MKHLYIYLAISIAVLGLSLRLFGIFERAPFDWDQNRDYVAVSSIASGKLTLIGPVAKGEGGFFLGPLYYYMSLPLYILMDQNPKALPLTSVLIDVLTIVAILTLFRRRLGDRATLVLAFLWSVSWFAIELSRISWNVALVPLWLVLMLYLLSNKYNLSSWNTLILGVIAGLSWHIHASLIPLAIIMLLIRYRLWATTILQLSILCFGYLIAVSPLILFDARHAGLNYRLMTQFGQSSLKLAPSYLEVIISTLDRLGKNLEYFLTGSGNYNTKLGVVMTLLAAFFVAKGQGITRLAGIVAMINIALVIALRDPRFPEYYLSASYIPSLLLPTVLLTKYRKLSPVLGLLLIMFVVLNYQAYTTEPTSFALSHKDHMASDIAKLSDNVSLEYDLAPGREGGIKRLLEQNGVSVTSESKTKVLITAKMRVQSSWEASWERLLVTMVACASPNM